VTSGNPFVYDVPALATGTTIQSRRNSIITCLWTFRALARKEEPLITFAVAQYRRSVATSLEVPEIPCRPGELFEASVEARSECTHEKSVLENNTGRQRLYVTAIFKKQFHYSETLSKERGQFEMALMSCILFVCFDNLTGKFDSAITHLHSGLEILQSYRSLDALFYGIFVRLGLTSYVFG